MIKLEETNCAIAAAVKCARERGFCISVSVCDFLGHLVAHQRMDGASWEAGHYSIGKAIASAGLGIPSGDESRKDVSRSSVSVVIGSGAPVIRRPGGFPLKRDGDIIGSIGVSGAPSDEQGEECACCGLEAFAASMDNPSRHSAS
jgi:uncharacterized protein GlcG (DUF336 family)